MLDDPEVLATLGAVTSPLSTWMMKKTIIRNLVQAFTGVDRNANLPEFHRKTFRTWLKEERRG
jgi:hypothetical protein